jgi:hypothetical protein
MLLVWVILLFVGTELVVANLLEPWGYAANTGLSSVVLIAAATFWTWLWGPTGLLLSTPLTVCLVVLGRHVPQLEFLDVVLGNEPVLSFDETFYQCLLANDPEEATEQAEEFVKEGSLAEFFDEVAIPALVRAQDDSDDGTLCPERRLVIKESIRAMLGTFPAMRPRTHALRPRNHFSRRRSEPRRSFAWLAATSSTRLLGRYWYSFYVRNYLPGSRKRFLRRRWHWIVTNRRSSMRV